MTGQLHHYTLYAMIIKNAVMGTAPVCGAVVGYNCKLSHMMRVILAEVWKSRENNTICISTGDMIAEMNRANKNQEDDGLIIGSTDVVVLYPSLDIDFTIDKVCEVFFESHISIQGVDYAELGLYLAVTTSPEVLTKLGIAGVCPTRKTKHRPAMPAEPTKCWFVSKRKQVSRA